MALDGCVGNLPGTPIIAAAVSNCGAITYGLVADASGACSSRGLWQIPVTPAAEGLSCAVPSAIAAPALTCVM